MAEPPSPGLYREQYCRCLMRGGNGNGTRTLGFVPMTSGKDFGKKNNDRLSLKKGSLVPGRRLLSGGGRLAQGLGIGLFALGGGGVQSWHLVSGPNWDWVLLK